MVAVRGRFCFVSSCRINHLGINPVSGGRPPNESIVRVAVVTIIGPFDHDSASVLIFVTAISLNVRKAVDVMIMYVSRVRMVS